MARMTFYHKELLVNYIETNSKMVRNKGSGRAGAEEVRALWEEVAAKLGAAGAVARSGEEWKKAWGELLCRTKKLARMYARGKGSEKRLTPLDRRILAAGQGNLQLKHDFEDSPMNYDAPSLLKTESNLLEKTDAEEQRSKEMPVLHPTDDRTAESGTEDDDPDYSPPLSPLPNKKRHLIGPAAFDMEELYPKWLVDVERMRAQAELKRAEAAEQRALAAVKSADAALLQAQAITKLADAFTTQAEAVMRIAKAFETANCHRTVLK